MGALGRGVCRRVRVDDGRLRVPRRLPVDRRAGRVAPAAAAGSGQAARLGPWPPTVNPLVLPKGWVAAPAPAPYVLLARPASWQGACLPNLVVRIDETEPGESLTAYAERQAAGLVDALTEPLLIDLLLADDGGVFEIVVSHELLGRPLT